VAEAGGCQHGHGEAVPRHRAFVGAVIDAARRPQRQHVEQRLGEVAGEGRPADLVGHDRERLARPRPVEDGAREVPAAGAEHPARAHDAEAVAAVRQHRLLAQALAGAVGRQRAGRGVERVRRGRRTVEHEVRADVDEFAAGGGRRLGDPGSAERVDAVGAERVLFARIDVGRRRAVHDRTRGCAAHRGEDRRPVAQRHVARRDADGDQPAGRRRGQHGAAELPGAAGDQDVARRHRRAQTSMRLAPFSRTNVAERYSDSKVPASVHQPLSTS
jgi:hypothetical protein